MTILLLIKWPPTIGNYMWKFQVNRGKNKGVMTSRVGVPHLTGLFHLFLSRLKAKMSTARGAPTIITLWANSADGKLTIVSYFSQKIDFDIWYEETICRKCQKLFSWKTEKIIITCCLQKFLSSMQSVLWNMKLPECLWCLLTYYLLLYLAFFLLCDNAKTFYRST